jgi:PAS domain S-box-containing protein
MKMPLRVLMLEDSEDDALLTIRTLKKGGYEPEYMRVETADAMHTALQEKTWDLILCDYQMPQFNGLTAVALLKEAGIDIPLIIVSGAIGEDMAVECMRLGARDYIMKGNLPRLASAVERELKEAESRRQRKRAEKALQESEQYFRAILENSSDIIFIMDKLGTITYVSSSIECILGYTPDELIGKRTLDLIISEDKPRAIADFGRALLTKEAQIPNAFRVRHKNGTERILEGIGNNLLDHPIVAGFVMNVHDVSERKRAEQEMVILAEIGRVIGSTLEIDNVYDRAADEISKLIHFDSLTVNLFDATQETLTVAYVSGLEMPGRQVEDLYPIGGTMAEENVLTREGVIAQSESPERLADTFPSLNVSARAGMHSVMSVPLIAQDMVIGNLLMRSKKPMAYTEGDLRLAEKIGMQIAGAMANARLFSELKQAGLEHQQTIESLRRAFGTTVRVMVSAVETRDPYTSGHQTRSADLARAIATEMGLPQEKIDAIRIAGSIHDIGKLSIPAEILSKPTKLSELEFSLIKEHARKGFEMIKDVESPWPLAEILYQHHERMDGSGYPRNLKGEDICIEARILAVADVVEAMASHRPYRPGLGIDAALNEIEKNRGIFYDDAVADACLRLFREKGFQLAND